MTRVLVLEQGAGFGGALTSLHSFLTSLPAEGDFRFHVLSAYPQTLIQPGGAVERTDVLPRPRWYGPSSSLERALRRFLHHRAGNAAYLLDMLGPGARCALAVLGYIRRHDIDLVHLNNGVLINDAGLIGARLAGVPAVVHVRGPEYPGRITRWMARLAAHFLPVSEYIAGTLRAVGVTDDRMTVVPEGLDAIAFASGADGVAFRRELGIPDTVPVIGMVGCLVGWKGHEVFLEALRSVISRQPVLALIAGDTPDGSPAYRLHLEERARELGIADVVRFLGHCSRVPDMMAACDIMVHASTMPEPFGRVVLEAMALGRPVIATDAGGPSEILRHGRTGWLVPPGDATALAQGILALVSSPDNGREMGENARKEARSHYDVSHHMERLFTGYRNAMSLSNQGNTRFWKR